MSEYLTASKNSTVPLKLHSKANYGSLFLNTMEKLLMKRWIITCV